MRAATCLDMSDADASAKPRPLEALRPTGDARLDALAKLIAIVDRLRAPDGCPWDLEQSVQSMAPSLVEEAHELVEAIDRRDDAGSVEEAGDLLMVVVLIARIAEQAGRFDLARAGEAVCAKLVRRHPHVFGDVEVDGSAAAIANWEKIKQAERAARKADASALAGVPAALPALQRAHRLGEKAIAAGFQWTDARGAFAKLGEEVRELERELAAAGPEPKRAREPARAALEHELGDVLLAAALLGNYLGLDPERAARAAARRFETRFRAMERELGAPLSARPLDELLAAWARAKASERGG
jgi:MazG family protein